MAPLIFTPPSQKEKKIDKLTDIIQSLALLVRKLQESINAPLVASQFEPQSANMSFESRMSTNY